MTHDLIVGPGRVISAPFRGLDVCPHIPPRGMGTIDDQFIIVLVVIGDDLADLEDVAVELGPQEIVPFLLGVTARPWRSASQIARSIARAARSGGSGGPPAPRAAAIGFGWNRDGTGWRSIASLPHLAAGAIVRRPADQSGDPGLEDRPFARPAGQVFAAVDGILGQEAPFQAEDRAIAGVEARALQGDRRRQDLADRPVQPVELARLRASRPCARGECGRGAAPRRRRCCRSPRALSGPSRSA